MAADLADAVRAALDGAAAPNAARMASVALVAGNRVRSFTVTRTRLAAVPAGGRFLLYSFTKTIVAAALLRLVADGRLALDGALAPWLPGRAIPGRATLRQVLQHTSGLPDYGGIAGYHAAVRAGAAPWTEDEFLTRCGADRLLFEPGHGWAYSNIGYMLLRRVLERAGGDRFETVLRRTVLAPLGIADASVPVRRSDLRRFVFGPSAYLGGAGPPASVLGRYHPGWIAPGVVGASAGDAARLLHGILAADLLPRSLREEMKHSVPVGGPFPGRPWLEGEYGLGLMVAKSEAADHVHGHTGGGPGCSPAVFHFPEREPPLTVAVITDGEDLGQAEEMVLLVARHHGAVS